MLQVTTVPMGGESLCHIYIVKNKSKQIQSRSLPRGEHTGHMLCCMLCIFLSFFFFKFSSGVEHCSTLNTSLNVTNDILSVKLCVFSPPSSKGSAHISKFEKTVIYFKFI